jgi:hypothetical protein
MIGYSDWDFNQISEEGNTEQGFRMVTINVKQHVKIIHAYSNYTVTKVRYLLKYYQIHYNHMHSCVFLLVSCFIISQTSLILILQETLHHGLFEVKRLFIK